jgi:phosphatidylglycerol:prolipoprotein diacylglycerol transferase
MMAAGFLAAYWLTKVRMAEEGFGLNAPAAKGQRPTAKEQEAYVSELAASFLVWIMIGGVGGSKLYYSVDTWLRTGAPFNELLFARAGITWYGGLIGGFLAGAICSRLNGIRVLDFANCAAVGVAVGQSLGRVGCFLVGDDYGEPSDLPWALAFPLGAPPTHVPVHPTQLYEVAWLLPVAAVLWSRRKKSPFLFGEYMVANGLGRIVIEQWRVNPQVALGFTEPQWIGIALVVVGAGGWLHFRFRAQASQRS